MSEKPQASPPLQGVIIFVSQQLASHRATLHQLCTSLGGKFVWVFDIPFTHYICQGKLSKRGKEYKKVEEYRAKCVHPAWLKACHTCRHRIAEKLYATTYDPNRSLSFISAGDEDEDEEDEENHIPSLTTVLPVPASTQKPPHTARTIAPVLKKKSISAPIQPTAESPQLRSQLSNEAETMLNDLESSLAQFLHHTKSSINTVPRPAIMEDEPNRKSLVKIRSMNSMHSHQQKDTEEPSMRVEWLDDAMQAERKKMIDEDEFSASSQNQSQHTPNGSVVIGQKRPLIDSNVDLPFKSKKSRR